MAKSVIRSLTTTTEREILDVGGTPLASSGVTERAGPDGAGGLQKERTFVSIVTVDGAVYHSGMDLKLVVCGCCRRSRLWLARHGRVANGATALGNPCGRGMGVRRAFSSSTGCRCCRIRCLGL
jgi:hypothetical protein